VTYFKTLVLDSRGETEENNEKLRMAVSRVKIRGAFFQNTSV
jgi:hypothetical protein